MEQLYLKGEKGPVGPVGLTLLATWAENGRLSPNAPVSGDRRRWCCAADFPALAPHFSPAARASALEESHLGLAPAARRIPIKNVAEPADFTAWCERANNGGRWLAFRFHAAVWCGALAAMYALFAGLALLGRWALPGLGWLTLGAFSLPLCLLAGAAAGQAAGNIALGHALGLGRDARRAFALRLGWSRKPASWPGWLGRWVFAGDWLREPRLAGDVPFVRVFVVGDAAGSALEELPVWREAFRELVGRADANPERTRCEIAYVERLPDWSRNVGPGYRLDDLETAIGKMARQWARHFWHKACASVPELGAGSRVQEDAFRFHALRLADGREALAITLRGASGAMPQSEASRVLFADAA